MIKIKSLGKLEKIVNDHEQFLVKTKYSKWNNSIRRYERLFKEPILKRADELNKNDFIGTPINNKSIMFKADVPIHDNIFWWFIGRFLADGWCVEYKRKDRCNSYARRIVLCCGKHEFNTVNDKMVKLPYKFCVSEERTAYKFTMTNFTLYKFLTTFGKYAHGKCIPRKIINAPHNYLKHLIDGYLSGDGWYDSKSNLYKITTVSKQLLLDIQECIIKVHKIPVKIYHNKRPKTHVIEGRVVNQRDTYSLYYKLDIGKQDQAFSDHKYIWGPINTIITL